MLTVVFFFGYFQNVSIRKLVRIVFYGLVDALSLYAIQFCNRIIQQHILIAIPYQILFHVTETYHLFLFHYYCILLSVKDPAAVEETEAGGFKEMGGQDIRFIRKVGNRSGDLEDAGIGAG